MTEYPREERTWKGQEFIDLSVNNYMLDQPVFKCFSLLLNLCKCKKRKKKFFKPLADKQAPPTWTVAVPSIGVLKMHSHIGRLAHRSCVHLPTDRQI